MRPWQGVKVEKRKKQLMFSLPRSVRSVFCFLAFGFTRFLSQLAVLVTAVLKMESAHISECGSLGLSP